MNQIGQSIKKVIHFFKIPNDNDNNDNNDDDDTHPPWIIVRVRMKFRRGQKCTFLSSTCKHIAVSKIYQNRHL